MTGRLVSAACLAALALLLWAGPVPAHRVNVYAYPEGGALKGQGYFPGGAACRGCPVRLLGPQGRELARGETDQAGEFALTLPPQAGAPLTVVLEPGQGHRAEFRLAAQDLGRASAHGGTGPSQPDRAGTTQDADPEQGDRQKGATAGAWPEPKALEQAVRRAVRQEMDEALAPLRREMAELKAESEPGWRQAAAGMGYIVGILGLALWARSRRRG